MESATSSRFRWAALVLIAAAALLRLGYLIWNCPLDLAPDEAHYWDWSRQLDWCYYSKGPLVAWLIRASCELFGPLSQSLVGSEMLAVRIPAIACGSLLLGGLYVLTFQVYQNDRLALAVVAIALTLPIVVAGSTLMTIDAPFLAAWMWALVFGYRAVIRQSPWAWPMAGFCVMLGILAKHTMILWLMSFALFLLATPTMRGHLRRPGFWIMATIGLLGCVPILMWNALHGWVTIWHTQIHVGVEDELAFHPFGPTTYLSGQFAVLLGFWFIAWARATWRHRPTCETKPEIAFLWWMSLPTFIFFGLFSFTNGGGEPNWPLPTYLSGGVLTAGWMARELAHQLIWYRRMVRGNTIGFAALGLMVTALIHETIPLQPILLRISGPASADHPMPIRRIDPTSRLRGWRHLAAEVDRIRADLAASGIEPVLAAQRWTQAGELAFYCDGQPRIYCLGGPLGDRGSQYDLWRPNPIMDEADFLHRTFLLVGNEIDQLKCAFDSYETLRVVSYCENGQPIAEWTVALGRGFRGFSAKK